MAELQITNKDGRRKRHSAKVDLTPMVDLGFILITFFIYTTTLTQEKGLEINRPVDGEGTSYIDTSTITIIPASDHRFVYYHGTLDSKDKLITTDLKSIRTVIMQKESDLRNLPASYSKQARKLHVIIKPADNSSYGDMVNIMDEMLINKVPHYALTNITDEESAIVAEVL